METILIERIICETEVERRECIKNLEGLGYKVKPGSGWCLNNTDFNKLSLYDDNTFRASNIISMSPGENYDDFTYKAWKRKMLNVAWSASLLGVKFTGVTWRESYKTLMIMGRE